MVTPCQRNSSNQLLNFGNRSPCHCSECHRLSDLVRWRRYHGWLVMPPNRGSNQGLATNFTYSMRFKDLRQKPLVA
jgi:hypothetical protein